MRDSYQLEVSFVAVHAHTPQMKRSQYIATGGGTASALERELL
jgi:hypothetical protein